MEEMMRYGMINPQYAEYMGIEGFPGAEEETYDEDEGKLEFLNLDCRLALYGGNTTGNNQLAQRLLRNLRKRSEVFDPEKTILPEDDKIEEVEGSENIFRFKIHLALAQPIDLKPQAQ